MKREKKVIGRVEKVHLPDLELFDIEAKIDSGAYTSAIHCHDIWEDIDENILSFKLLDPSHEDYNQKILRFDSYTKTIIKSSNGTKEMRYKIKTPIQIGKKSYLTNFTLTNRSDMKYPILLGRVVLKSRFLIDVSTKYNLNLKK